MRWSKKPSPVVGDQRTVSKFLWLPLTMQEETRWLEFTPITQIYRTYMQGVGPIDCVGWRNLKWGEDPEPDTPDVTGTLINVKR